MPKAKRSKTRQTEAAVKARVDKTLERQAFLMQLYRRGITQPDQVVEMYRKKGYDIAERTIRDDRMKVRQLLHERFLEEKDTTAAEAMAQLDDLAVQFQQIAQQALDPNGKKSYYAAVQALGQKKDVVMSKAKLVGAVVEKQEVSGEVRNLNLNAELPAESLLDLWKAAKKAGMSDEEAQAALAADVKKLQASRDSGLSDRII